MNNALAMADEQSVLNGAAETIALPLMRDILGDVQSLGEGLNHLLSRFAEQHARVGQQIADILDLFPENSGAARIPAIGAAPAVVVTCLGSFEIRVGGVLITNWRPGRARALFQYLVCHRQQPNRRDQLVDALWPDPDAVAAQSSLKVAVHALRQTLRQSLGDNPGLQVVASEAGYQLASEGLWLDTDQFESLCRQAEAWTRAGQPLRALQSCREAANLYRGDFLVDCGDDWALFRREALKDQYLSCVSQLADAALDAEDWQTCLGYCRQILDQDRCREDAFRTLMLCHAQLGQPNRVRRWFELCQRALRTELDAEPEPETLQLYERLVGATAPRALPREMSAD